MTTVEAYLGLGSNLGDRERNLASAVSMLDERLAAPVILSSVYETKPWGYADQPDFLNLACRVETGLKPEALLGAAQEVERLLGRVPTFPYGPRAIDVDILLYGDQVVDTPELRVPHPHLIERAFALSPLAELAPELLHPELGVSIRELLERLPRAERDGVSIVGPLLRR
ncbi:MAG: 2-amino-4-hydroxy-6-hydroxymethyldihydropteridine diphosphokinase [Chloroflexota bacterium]|nr:2-amino-4-hydroxy-6-hydroxymethyldihydropteridine diphosphokinase [Chloroflexota bacterium]MDE2942460.1 2-amino-4-hydroxy-6-hydroxymethyldihydropteridine diphosphokinase [Chloroflexota bacterium]MDE3267860.1 2-amino-4-hydroxy-6-hydroxymethyldihydropteridine diphosphokinase [Chloroflexota bacterium]